MSLTHNRLSSNVLLALLAPLLFLVAGGKADAQYDPRLFQMSLAECCNNAMPPPPLPTPADVDIRGLNLAAEVTQPPGLYLLQGLGPTSPLPNFDWSRIVAVEVDEPYYSIDGDLTTGDCTTPTDPNLAIINSQLQTLASAVKSKNPKVRFWVNLDYKEADWIQKCYFQFGVVSLSTFNQTYFDVISVDWYNQVWSQGTTIQAFYEVAAANPATPHQQVALVPGVFSSPDQSGYLSGYFDYANTQNQGGCNLPLPPGSQGVTGIFDGCPVWIIMGWETGDAVYPGYFNSGSQLIRTDWQGVVADPPGLMLTRARSWIATFSQPSINLLLQ